jgi:hypothetical protein
MLLSCCVMSLYGGLQDALLQAEKRQLHKARYWHLLLHMPDGKSSEIDSPEFFLSPHGKNDPKAELEATIAALYNETVFDDNATACRYPARKAWLVDELGLEGLPGVEGRAYETLLKRLDPRSATLVFPDAHINSPASMFGHTFIRIDSSYQSKLLSYAVNYAARADQKTENGVVFAVKGLFGGYPGVYSLLPYYDKLKEYSDTEQRDIWEYDLNLTRDEVLRMVRHVWELNRSYSWYYFFDENCSYNMLWLIEAARPQVRLRERFVYQVLPPETLNALAAEGLIVRKHYRPSKRSLLLAYEAALGDEEEQMALALAEGRMAPPSVAALEAKVQTRRYMLEAAAELTEYRYIKADINQSTYTRQLHALLRQRSYLGRGEEIAPETPENPLEGHRTNRLSLQTGWRHGRPIQFIGYRPAYHDISDSGVGFLRGTQIEALNVLLAYRDDAVDVESATLLSIVSLAQRSAFFRPFSWRIRAGWDNDFLSERTDISLRLGAGYSWGSRDAYGYVLIEPLVYFDDDPVSGVGTVAGGVMEWDRRAKMRIEAVQRWYDRGDEQFAVSATQLWRVEQNIALKLHYEYMEKDAGDEVTFKVGMDYFF